MKSIKKISIMMILILSIVTCIGCSSSSSSSSSSNRNSEAWSCAQNIVKNNLKSPSSAKFCSYSSTTITSNGDDYTIKGYLDAENGFGGNIRNNFTVKLTLTKSGYKNGTVSFY